MTPIAVPAPELDAWLPRIEWHLKSFCRSGQWTPEELVEQIRSRDRQLWVVFDGEVRAAVLTAVMADRLNTVQVTHCAGRGAGDWLHLWPVLEGWARDIGAKRIEAVARPGWERKLKDMGMRKTHVVLEKRL